MKKNMLSIILASPTFICLSTTAVLYSRCGDRITEDEEKTDIETKDEAVEESEGEPVEAGSGI